MKSKKDHEIIHIDCTLRDGGYYNQWNFDKELIEEYLKTISLTSINYAEIGFRNLDNKNFKGPLAFTTDEYLKTLNLPSNINLAVMINSSILKSEKECISRLEKLFPNDSYSSSIKLVRIASDLNNLAISLKASSFLKSKGFKVGINITKISQKSSQDLEIICKSILNSKIDVLYIADSLGSMRPDKIEFVIKLIKKYCINFPLGIHTHDNLGLALTNTLKALKNGVTWIDSSVLGMGRGPGNCKTEEILIELNPKHNFYDLSLILDLSETHFLKLKEFYKWGTNPFYYICGLNEIHPSYIQEITKDSLFKSDDKFALLKKLINTSSHDYTKKYNINQIIEYKLEKHTSEWEPKTIFQDKEVLIISTGPSSLKYKNVIESYIKKRNPIVIALNTPSPISNELINYRSACHPLRILADSMLYKNLNQTLICPYSMLKDEINLEMEQNRILDYGISLMNQTFEFKNNFCKIPYPLVLIYTICFALSGNAKIISITGVDGYKFGDERNEQLNYIFELISKIMGSNSKIYSLTPSIYKNLNKKSIFGFL